MSESQISIPKESPIGGSKISKVWGINEEAVNNIIGLVSIILLALSFIYTFIYPWLPTKNPGVPKPLDIWLVVVPAITGGFGFLIGRKTS